MLAACRPRSEAFELLRAGRLVDDRQFDAVFPFWVRQLSDRFWSPVAVARRAAEFLVTGAHSRILDVGAGVGKFCLVGSCTTAGLFYGVELEHCLVEVAREVTGAHGVERARCSQGDALALDWRRFDGFYLFNPFVEHVGGLDGPAANGDRFSRAERERCARRVRAKLADARRGTRVVTYNGYGGRLPGGYRKIASEGVGGACLELWLKTCPPPRSRDGLVSG